MNLVNTIILVAVRIKAYLDRIIAFAHYIEQYGIREEEFISSLLFQGMFHPEHASSLIIYLEFRYQCIIVFNQQEF